MINQPLVNYGLIDLKLTSCLDFYVMKKHFPNFIDAMYVLYFLRISGKNLQEKKIIFNCQIHTCSKLQTILLMPIGDNYNNHFDRPYIKGDI